MRLTHLRLAGFKSFVDPTAIPVPGQLVAVCGPNGCGKSNVIDAVRWVLGESSARQLRGESMQDVIFNGASSRKPVSRASVELVFDNSEGRAAGAWSQYGEISIKRSLTRAGESAYYINNLQCRRRDIADLFLGTGVGTRGYAVIEQGMITRIIEAKPEELRAFLEEAAGVSKYKERRKETEARLADSRDNLARVDDIRQELLGQLEKLAEQAQVAENFQNLKSRLTERQNLLALQRKLDAEREEAQARAAIAQAQTALESQGGRLREVEAAIELAREAHYDATDGLSTAQAHLSEAAASVARQEQKLLHLRETRNRLSQQQAQARQRLDGILSQQASLAGEMTQYQDQLEEAQFCLEDIQLELLAASEAMPAAEAQFRALEDALGDAQLAYSHAKQSAQLANQQCQHLERALQQLQLRQQKQRAELAALPMPEVDQVEDAQLELAELKLQQEQAQIELHSLEQQQQSLEQARAQARQDVEGQRSQVLALSARAQALAQLQAQLGSDQHLHDWLNRQGLHDVPRLFSLLTIAPGWERALEAVLDQRCMALIQAPQDLQDLAPASLTCLSPANPLPNLVHPPGFSPLLEKVHSADTKVTAALYDWLAQVYCCEHDAQLWQGQSQLPNGALLVAPSGHAVSRQATHYYGQGAQVGGVLQREQELLELNERISRLNPILELAQLGLNEIEQGQGRVHAELKHARLKLDAMRKQAGEKQVEVARLSQAMVAAKARSQALREELAGQDEEVSELALELEGARLELQDLQVSCPSLQQAMDLAKLAKIEAETGRDVCQARLRQVERQAQQAGFAKTSAQSKVQELQRRQQDLAAQFEQASMQLEDASFELEGLDEGEFDIGFQEAINLRMQHERLVASQREALNACALVLREREQEKALIETGFDPLREQLSALRLQEQEARLNLARFSQELDEAQADVAALLPLIGNGLKVSGLINEIGRLGQAINALGNVNLAALEELEAARARRDFLDAQAQDLEAAMQTLENAIRKIDRETRAMLQTTFDAVNGSLQELFPTLFGGGHAELILTGEEILDAGIQIMAQPPGKKNATIHLLSGGEKALTALSLVFALFKLNPAPFCLLDEVDAPLDDANTSRFCDMVKRMAVHTQFLYISHNKLTMEMADQLVGITMQEQGVSRVVAVDMDEALRMRELA